MDNTSSAHCPRCGASLDQGSVDGLCAKCLGALNFATDTALPGESVAAIPPPTPEEIAEHFPQLEVIEFLGRGGMGVVYKARQKALGRLVALKLLAPERVADPKFAERFAHEAKALAALNHPSIVTIHDFGQAGGFFYLLMEFVDGVNLRQAMKAGRFTPEQALAIVPPVCEALQYAHEHGIVHRDIKPENLLLDREGRVKIADFGIAKILGESGTGVPPVNADATAGTAESHSIAAGTPHYMAPEQKAHRVTDHRADIYSLGVVLYELLTGELPADKLQPPSRKVQIDVRLDEIVLRALEAKPELRYQTAGEMRTQVVAATDAMHDAAHPAGAASPSAWKPPTTGWGYVVGAFFGITFTSPLAFKLANLSALGFLGFLGFVGLSGIDGLHSCLGFFGFSGFFGLPGVAFIVEMAHRRKSSTPMPTGGAEPDINPAPQPRWQGWDVWVIGLCLVIFGALWLYRLADEGVLHRPLYDGAGVGANIVLPIALATIVLLAGAAFLYMLARNIKTAAPTRAESWKRTVGRAIVPAIAVALLLRTFVIHAFVVPNNSMSPEITKGSRILVWKLTSTYAPGDIVAYRHEDKIWVARVTQVGPTMLTLQKNKIPSTEVHPDVVVGKVISVFWRPSPGAAAPEVPPSPLRAEKVISFLAGTGPWSPSSAPVTKEDVRQISAEAKALQELGRYEEALQRHLWLHHHALEIAPSLFGLRMSFWLSDWAELAHRFPKAKQALIEIRDQKSHELRAGRGDFGLFIEVDRINSCIHEDAATLALFKQIVQSNPELAKQCAPLVEEAAARLSEQGEREITPSQWPLEKALADLQAAKAERDLLPSKSFPSEAHKENEALKLARKVELFAENAARRRAQLEQSLGMADGAAARASLNPALNEQAK